MEESSDEYPGVEYDPDLPLLERGEYRFFSAGQDVFRGHELPALEDADLSMDESRALLRRMWQFAAIQYMLCSLMVHKISTEAVLDGVSLENAVLLPEDNFQLLEDIHLFLLSTSHRKLQEKGWTWTDALERKMSTFHVLFSEENPLTECSYTELTPFVRVSMLYVLAEDKTLQLDFYSSKKETLEPRVTPIGQDRMYNDYYYFGPRVGRLFLERHSTISTKTLRGGSWETVCCTPAEVEELAASLCESSRAPQERALGKLLREQIYPELRQVHDQLERKKRKVMQSVVVAPRKKSSRVIALEQQKEEERVRREQEEAERTEIERVREEERARKREARRIKELQREREREERMELQRQRAKARREEQKLQKLEEEAKRRLELAEAQSSGVSAHGPSYGSGSMSNTFVLQEGKLSFPSSMSWGSFASHNFGQNAPLSQHQQSSTLVSHSSSPQQQQQQQEQHNHQQQGQVQQQQQQQQQFPQSPHLQLQWQHQHLRQQERYQRPLPSSTGMSSSAAAETGGRLEQHVPPKMRVKSTSSATKAPTHAAGSGTTSSTSSLHPATSTTLASGSVRHQSSPQRSFPLDSLAAAAALEDAKIHPVASVSSLSSSMQGSSSSGRSVSAAVLSQGTAARHPSSTPSSPGQQPQWAQSPQQQQQQQQLQEWQQQQQKQWQQLQQQHQLQAATMPQLFRSQGQGQGTTSSEGERVSLPSVRSLFSMPQFGAPMGWNPGPSPFVHSPQQQQQLAAYLQSGFPSSLFAYSTGSNGGSPQQSRSNPAGPTSTPPQQQQQQQQQAKQGSWSPSQQHHQQHPSSNP